MCKRASLFRHYTGVFDISNVKRLGKSEVHLIHVMVEGVAKLIEFERRLEAGGMVILMKLTESKCMFWMSCCAQPAIS